MKHNEVVGVDFGIKDDLILNNGIKFQTKLEVSKEIKREQRKLSKKKKGSNNYWKQKQKLAKQWEKQNNKKTLGYTYGTVKSYDSTNCTAVVSLLEYNWFCLSMLAF